MAIPLSHFLILAGLLFATGFFGVLLRRNAIVPQLLARDPALINALNSADYRQSSQRLISYVDEIGAASLMLLRVKVSTADLYLPTRVVCTPMPYFSKACPR